MTISENATIAINSEDTQEVFLELLVIDGEEVPSPIRLVRNNVAFTHQGNEYLPFDFQAKLPGSSIDQIQDAEITLFDVVQVAVPEIRRIQGDIYVTMSIIMASEPDQVQEGPVTMRLRDVEWDSLSIKGVIGAEQLLNSRYPPHAMNKQNAPGIHS